jgi:hypothetical protein
MLFTTDLKSELCVSPDHQDKYLKGIHGKAFIVITILTHEGYHWLLASGSDDVMTYRTIYLGL